MAEIQVEEKGKGGKKKPKKGDAHVDMTPMGPYESAHHVLHAHSSFQQTEGHGNRPS